MSGAATYKQSSTTLLRNYLAVAYVDRQCGPLLYRWAQDRDLADHDPAALVRLPAMDAKPIERVASPAEFAELLDALPLDLALPTPPWPATEWPGARRSSGSGGPTSSWT